MNLSWLAETVFFGSYFVAWCVGAFNVLTSVSNAAHTWIVISAIAALVVALSLLGFNGRDYYDRRRAPAA